MAHGHDNPTPGKSDGHGDGHAHSEPSGDPTATATALPQGYDLVLDRHGRRLVFRVLPGQEQEVLARVAEMADDPDDDLSWYDAALLGDQIGKVLRHRIDTPQAFPPVPPRPNRRG